MEGIFAQIRSRAE
jgi:hypothetical protein